MNPRQPQRRASVWRPDLRRRRRSDRSSVPDAHTPLAAVRQPNDRYDRKNISLIERTLGQYQIIVHFANCSTSGSADPKHIAGYSVKRYSCSTIFIGAIVYLSYQRPRAGHRSSIATPPTSQVHHLPSVFRSQPPLSFDLR